jgi:hypothetical protein
MTEMETEMEAEVDGTLVTPNMLEGIIDDAESYQREQR